MVMLSRELPSVPTSQLSLKEFPGYTSTGTTTRVVFHLAIVTVTPSWSLTVNAVVPWPATLSLHPGGSRRSSEVSSQRTGGRGKGGSESGGRCRGGF